MTTIKASEYSPTVALNPLTPGQVTLLNKGAANDISQRVKTIVQTHLGYQGNENFRATFTKKEVTFTLTTGPATENRTLKLVNGHWMLSQNSTASAALDPTVEAEVNTLITEILSNIGKASRANVPDPVHSTATVDAADDSELAQIKARLASLENQLRSNLTLEQSLKVQQQILDELIGLRSALEKQSHGNNTEELRRHIEGLKKTFEARDDVLHKSEAELERKLAEFDKQRSQLLVEKTKLEQQLEIARSTLADTTQKLNFERDELKKQFEDLQQDLKTKEDELNRFTKTVEAEFGRLQEGFKAEKTNFQKRQEALQDQYDKLESQFKIETTFSNFLSNESIPTLQKSLNEKDQKLKAATQAAEENESQLRSELENVKQSLEKSEEDRFNIVAANNAKVEKMREIIVQIDQQTTDLTPELEAARAENYTFTQNIQNLQESLQEKKRLLEQSENDAALTEKRVATLERENEYLNLVIEDAEQEKKLETDRSDLNNTKQKAQRRELYSKYLEARLKHLEGTDEVGILTKENSNLREKSSSAELTVEMKKQEIALLSEQLEIAAKNIVQIESLSKQLETATLNQEFLQTKADGYKSDRDAAEQLAKEAMEAYQIAKDNESQINNEFDAYREEMEAFVEEQKTELAARQSKNEDLKDQLETEKEFKDLVFALNQNLQKSVEEKDQELAIAAQEAKENAQKVNDAFLEAQRQIKDLEGELDQAQREIRYLRPRVNDELDIKQQWKNNENRS